MTDFTARWRTTTTRYTALTRDFRFGRYMSTRSAVFDDHNWRTIRTHLFRYDSRGGRRNRL